MMIGMTETVRILNGLPECCGYCLIRTCESSRWIYVNFYSSDSGLVPVETESVSLNVYDTGRDMFSPR